MAPHRATNTEAEVDLQLAEKMINVCCKLKSSVEACLYLLGLSEHKAVSCEVAQMNEVNWLALARILHANAQIHTESGTLCANFSEIDLRRLNFWHLQTIAIKQQPQRYLMTAAREDVRFLTLQLVTLKEIRDRKDETAYLNAMAAIIRESTILPAFTWYLPLFDYDATRYKNISTGVLSLEPFAEYEREIIPIVQKALVCELQQVPIEVHLRSRVVAPTRYSIVVKVPQQYLLEALKAVERYKTFVCMIKPALHSVSPGDWIQVVPTGDSLSCSSESMSSETLQLQLKDAAEENMYEAENIYFDNVLQSVDDNMAFEF